MNKHQTSNYWLGEGFFKDDNDLLGKGKLGASEMKGDPIKMAAYQNAIGNFVRIVTNKAIPVRFSSAGDSYTDGKKVVISANLNDKHFDSAVGLALHEGSHIAKTDFRCIQPSYIEDVIQKDDAFVMAYAEKYKLADRWEASMMIHRQLKDLLNVVEDRRIDNFVYRTAPGYQGYYRALYDKYFNDKIIDKGLRSDEYREENWESYMFRIINITNANRDLDALNGLREIWKELDLKNINRLKSTRAALDVAYEIFKIVEGWVPAPKDEDECENTCESDSDQTQEQEQEEKEGQGQGNGQDNDEGEQEDDGSNAEGGEPMPGGGEGPLNPREVERLKKAMRKQKDFLNGDVKKSNLSKKARKQIEQLAEAGIENREVEWEAINEWSGTRMKVANDVIFIPRVTKSMIEGVDSMMWDHWNAKGGNGGRYLGAVEEGMRMGAMLGKKLKVRAEDRDTKFNRLRSGKIDKRMIANAGFGVEGIFEKIETFSFRPGLIHLSIDNSGSMNGNKMRQAIKCATSIAKACSMIPNMDCVISFRAGASIGDGYSNNADKYKPTIMIAYDSRRDSMVTIKQVFQYIDCCGGTPEGLCFAAIMKEIESSAIGKDAYFVNFSDGEPWFANNKMSYSSRNGALEHTAKQVRKMKNVGINVLSYFIGSGYSDKENFQKMYGKTSEFVDVQNVTDVARTLNKKFLQVK